MSRKALLGLVLLGWALRAAPLLSYPLDYDEGVYYSAAALWLKGCWPYRDFVFVHPPGILYALLPFGLCQPSLGLLLARLAMTLVAAASIAMAATLSSRSFGPGAGYLTAFCYAIYPEAAASERRLLLEPLLNALILGMLLSTRGRAALWLGCALTVKAWAALWLLAGWPRLRFYSLAALGVAALACAPPWLEAPQAFWQQVVSFQLHRPAHDSDGLGLRLLDIFDARHLVITGLAVLGWWRWRGKTLSEVSTQIARAWMLLILAMTLAPAHFFQYNTHLAVPECFWAGAAWPAVTLRPRLTALLLSVPFAFVLAGWLKSDAAMAERASLIRSLVGTESLYCFEPGHALWADRLPDRGGGAPVIVDSYATMLIDAGPGFATVPQAMSSHSAQTRLRQRLQVSQWLVVEERAHDQIDESWLNQHFKPRSGDLWHAR
ncbi:hypothetical protein IV102_22835 [bacterium]|nr:hypothetical protein [bacterium]